MSKIISSRRLYLFFALAFSIPLLFFILLETGLRVAGYDDTQQLFIAPTGDTANGAYLTINPSIARRYFPQQGFVPQPPNDLFRKQKPGNGYRIFVLGESTTGGWPYPENVMFSRLLEQRLADAFPGKYVEVVNTGIAAVSSYTLLDFMGEILRQKPDAILIYAGHNEFYGALGAASTQSLGQSRWLITSYLHLLQLRTVQFIRNGVNEFARRLHATSDQKPTTLMERMIGDKSIPYGSPTYQLAKANYAANLRDILQAANGAGVPVLISELVSNIRDHKPFVSVDDGKNPPADIVYAQAQVLEQAQQFDQAKAAYTRAKDLDGMRFRAPEEFNAVIHKVATEFNVPVVPMKSYFEKESPHGIIGASLMLEHLHPNTDGYLLMSEAFFDAMQQHKFISANWDTSKILSAASYRQSWPVTGFDRAFGELRIISLTDHAPYPPKSPGQPSIDNFQPRNKAEELAFKQFKGEFSYLGGHVKMAEYLEAEGKHELALREYYALISAMPYSIESYLPALNARKVTPGDFEAAHRYLRQLERLDIAEPGKLAALQRVLEQQEKSAKN